MSLKWEMSSTRKYPKSVIILRSLWGTWGFLQILNLRLHSSVSDASAPVLDCSLRGVTQEGHTKGRNGIYGLWSIFLDTLRDTESHEIFIGKAHVYCYFSCRSEDLVPQRSVCSHWWVIFISCLKCISQIFLHPVNKKKVPYD